MKEFHIINVGVSIITNYQRSLNSSDSIKNAKLSDNNFWSSCLSNKVFLNDIYNFIYENPKKNSAELNAFLRKRETSSESIEVYFTGTETPVNEICVRTLERYLKNLNITTYTTKEFPGYFLEPYIGDDKTKSFIEGISNMLDHLIKLARKKKNEGYRVFFNPTGGFKAHVIANALAGFMSYCEVYYLNEEFEDIIVFPPLFYIPKGNEKNLLEILSDKEPRVGKELEKLLEMYGEEVDRLIGFGLIHGETNEKDSLYRIKITSRGYQMWNEIKDSNK